MCSAKQKRRSACGSAAPRLAVPCGTHCWLPPWHLLFPAPTLCVLLLFYPAVRTHSAVMPRQFCSTDRFIGRLTGYFRGERDAHRMDGERGEARGGGRGHFGSPSLREPELQGHGEERQGAHPGRSGCLFILFSLCFESRPFLFN